MAANLLRFFGLDFLELIQNKVNTSHTFAKVMGLKISTNKVSAATYKVFHCCSGSTDSPILNRGLIEPVGLWFTENQHSTNQNLSIFI